MVSIKYSRPVLFFGMIGITGALLTILSDIILIGRPGSGYEYFFSGTEILAGISMWRITTGAFMGIVALPLQIAGIGTIYYGLLPAGRLIRYCMLLPMAYALIIGVAFHMSYAFIGAGWKLHNELVQSNNNISSVMIATYISYWKALIFIMFIMILFSSVFFTVAVLKKQTFYPRWMALLNPLCIFLLMFLIVMSLPSPAGAYAGSAYLNSSTLIFLILSTLLIYKRLNKKEGIKVEE